MLAQTIIALVLDLIGEKLALATVRELSSIPIVANNTGSVLDHEGHFLRIFTSDPSAIPSGVEIMAMHKLIIEHLERRNFLRAREIQSILARAATFPAEQPLNQIQMSTKFLSDFLGKLIAWREFKSDETAAALRPFIRVNAFFDKVNLPPFPEDFFKGMRRRLLLEMQAGQHHLTNTRKVKIGRNDQFTVRYLDGNVKTAKYKHLEVDLQDGLCVAFDGKV